MHEDTQTLILQSGLTCYLQPQEICFQESVFFLILCYYHLSSQQSCIHLHGVQFWGTKPSKVFHTTKKIRRDGFMTLQNESFALVWCWADFLKPVKVTSRWNTVFQISSKCMEFTDPLFSSLATKLENLLFAQLWLWIICVLGYENDFKNMQKRTKSKKNQEHARSKEPRKERKKKFIPKAVGASLIKMSPEFFTVFI